METFRIIEGFENYSVSDHGNVKNNKTARIMKQTIQLGYHSVALTTGATKFNRKVHILVLNAFLNNLENKPCVDHIDNDKSNNNISNLRWATHTENGRNQTISKANKSGVKGVLWDKKTNKWKASITIDCILIYLGVFDNLKDAKRARIKRSTEALAIYTNACEQINYPVALNT